MAISRTTEIKSSSVISFDDAPICEYYNPRLTSVHYPVNEMAETVTNILLKLIHNKKPLESKNIIIPPKLIIRESAGPVSKK